MKGVCTAGQLASLAGSGAWALPVEAVVDAMSVFTNITAADVKLPLEESLVAIVMAIREQFSVGQLRALWVVPDRRYAGRCIDEEYGYNTALQCC